MCQRNSCRMSWIFHVNGFGFLKWSFSTYLCPCTWSCLWFYMKHIWIRHFGFIPCGPYTLNDGSITIIVSLKAKFKRWRENTNKNMNYWQTSFSCATPEAQGLWTSIVSLSMQNRMYRWTKRCSWAKKHMNMAFVANVRLCLCGFLRITVQTLNAS